MTTTDPGRRIFDQHMNDDGTFRDPTSVDIPPAPGQTWRDLAVKRGEQLVAVNNLHQSDETGRACDGCGQTMPCNTRRILDRRRP